MEEFEKYFDRLWPLLRSISGDGVRKTHEILSEIIPLTRYEIPTGKKVFDWIIPDEWNVKEAYVIDPDGNKILNIEDNNLYLLNYSIPFKGEVSLDELDNHLYSIPNQEDLIPYVTSYYKKKWGFCISQNMRKKLKKGIYKVLIDSELKKGSLTISEALLKGKSKKEVFFSTYTCHPSMANNELSGPLICAFLFKKLSELPERRLTYRFVFLPETIGSITYLKLKGRYLKNKIIAGYVVTCAGDNGPFTYKRSRSGNSLSDKVAEFILYNYNTKKNPLNLNMNFNEYIQFVKRNPENKESRIIDFFPTGSDERQYCSQGFNLPIGSLMRSMYGTYKEYHTSADNKDFISFEALQESLELYYKITMILEKNEIFLNKYPYGEPRLGIRGLYPRDGAQKDVDVYIEGISWLLNLADGKNDLIDISKKSKIDFDILYNIAQKCINKNLLKKCN